MTLRKAAMTIWKKTVLKKKKASTNSSLSVKSLGFQLVMNLQPCATAFCIAKTSTFNISYLSSLPGLSMLCRDSNLPVKCWPPCFVFWILKSSSLSYVCPIDVGSCHLDYLARLLSFNFKWDSLRLTERSSPKIADYRFSQAFAKGRTTSTLQVGTFVVIVLTVFKYEKICDFK